MSIVKPDPRLYISITKSEKKIFRIQDIGKKKNKYLDAYPVDIWVELIAKALGLLPLTPTGNKKEVATAFIDLSLSAGISPIRLNQGAWYFSSRIVADQGRLMDLIRVNRSIGNLKKETSLIKNMVRYAESSFIMGQPYPIDAHLFPIAISTIISR